MLKKKNTRTKQVEVKPFIPQIKRNYKPLIFDEESADVFFQIQQKKVSAHKCVLIQSKTLLELIKNNQLEIKNISLKTFKRLLDYLYFIDPQVKELTVKDYVELYFASKFYKLDGLRHELYINLSGIVNLKNGLEFMKEIEEYKLLNRDYFKDWIMDYIFSQLDFYIDDKTLGLYDLEDDLRIQALVSYKKEITSLEMININKEILSFLKLLRTSLEYSDLELISDSQKFKVHKIIFYSVCPLLKGTNQINLSKESMEYFLDWIYLREFPEIKNEKLKNEIIEFATSFGIELSIPEINRINRSTIRSNENDEDDENGLNNLFN